MKQKASIAVSLIHDPKVVIFDEPTTGLDIITAKAVTDYLKELRKQGKLIIMSTPYHVRGGETVRSDCHYHRRKESGRGDDTGNSAQNADGRPGGGIL